jgi:hypothetical protein
VVKSKNTVHPEKKKLFIAIAMIKLLFYSLKKKLFFLLVWGLILSFLDLLVIKNYHEVFIFFSNFLNSKIIKLLFKSRKY